MLVAGESGQGFVRFLAVRRYSYQASVNVAVGDVRAFVIKEWPWLAY